ncbi:Trm112 family protein [Aliiglaciecola sp. 3_MG-2023]|uniref:Trm112 family protein n=1 Tax=Aliiglaciecola sp. 3_MG-2023 TaxID=3062644 RepID=UPI0026E31CF5|nr:Trm112 family protein [Aliiglaciecola sp. 3_MG-2023]MDO6693602.1 Trm112 family protein [Aliiglaciecola sp. 3_MG-2023]
MAFDKKLLEILACPVCKGKLQYQAKDSELICRFDRLAFSIKDNIPVMLENEARELTSTDIENLDQR